MIGQQRKELKYHELDRATFPQGYFKIHHGKAFWLGLDSYMLLELRYFTRSFKTGLDLWEKKEITIGG